MRHWRTVTMAALLHVVVAAGISTAQTLIVTRAGAGSSVELVFNAAKVGSAIADATGLATIDVNKVSADGAALSVRLAVDLCKDLVRVQMIDAGVMAPPEPGCTRREISGLFVMRHITTFVIDVSQAAPAVWVAQGPAPKPWLSENAPTGSEVRGWGVLPKGLVLGGGGGMTKFSHVVTDACGNASACSGNDREWGVNAAATFWLTRWVAAEVSLLNPFDVTISGSGTGYRFSTTLATRIVSIVGKVGATAGPARLYGFAGTDYHWVKSFTSETTDPSTVTVGDATVTIPGASQNYGLSAPGWGWLFGGGVEIWVKRRFAIFGEGGWIPLKENNEFGGEAKIDDRVIYLIGGVRFHVL